MSARSLSILYKIDYRTYLVLALFFVIPAFNRFSNITIALLFVVTIYQIIQKRQVSKIQFFWFLPMLFLYYLISEMISGGIFSNLEKRLLLVIIPLAFALNPFFYKEELREKIYISFIAGNLVAVLVCVARAIFRSVVLENGQLGFNPKVIQDTPYDFFTSAVMGGNYFFGDQFSLFLHPTYAGIFIVFAQYLISEVFKSTKRSIGKQTLVGCYIIFLVALFMLSSKAAIVSSLAVLFWIFLRAPLASFLKASAIAGVLVISILFLFFNPRLKVFKDTIKTSQLIDPNARYGYDLRILSWDASRTLIEDHWLFGVGEGKKRAALVDVYESKGYIVPAEQLHNSHNQYLDFLIGGGIIGLGLFLSGLITLMIRAIRDDNRVLMVFLFIFSFNALFENLLSRHAGILFFAAFITLLASRRQGLSTAYSPKTNAPSGNDHLNP